MIIKPIIVCMSLSSLPLTLSLSIYIYIREINKFNSMKIYRDEKTIFSEDGYIYLLTGAVVMFGSRRLSVWDALSRIECSPSQHGERARKGIPNIACSTSHRQAYLSRRWLLSMRSKSNSKENTSSSGTTQIDLINVLLLLLLNLPGTKLTLPPPVRPGW